MSINSEENVKIDSKSQIFIEKTISQKEQIRDSHDDDFDIQYYLNEDAYLFKGESRQNQTKSVVNKDKVPQNDRIVKNQVNSKTTKNNSQQTILIEDESKEEKQKQKKIQMEMKENEEIDEVCLNKRGKRVLSNKIVKLIIKKYESSKKRFDTIWIQTFQTDKKRYGNHLLLTVILIIKKAIDERSKSFKSFAPFKKILEKHSKYFSQFRYYTPEEAEEVLLSYLIPAFNDLFRRGKNDKEGKPHTFQALQFVSSVFNPYDKTLNDQNLNHKGVQLMDDMKKFLERTSQFKDNLTVAQILFKAQLHEILSEKDQIVKLILGRRFKKQIMVGRFLLCEKYIQKLAQDFAPKDQLIGSGHFDSNPIEIEDLQDKHSEIAIILRQHQKRQKQMHRQVIYNNHRSAEQLNFQMMDAEEKELSSQQQCLNSVEFVPLDFLNRDRV